MQIPYVITTNTKKLKIKYALFLVLSLVQAYHTFAQNSNNDVIGQGFDIRFVDPLNWSNSSKGKVLIKGGSSSVPLTTTNQESYHFITTPYEFEEELLQSNKDDRPYLGINSDAYYKAFKTDGSDKLLFVYTQKRVPTERRTLRNANTKVLDSALVEDFRRLGRDITPEGFIHRYGTHYADNVVYGGIFLRRNQISASDYIYSPYKEEEFKQKVVEDIINVHTGLKDTDIYINSGVSNTYTVGGDENAMWFDRWEQSITQNSKPIEVRLKSFSQLLQTVSIPNIEDKLKKVNMLDSTIQAITKESKNRLQPEIKSSYYKKYSLRFKQKLTSIVKKSMGRDANNPNDYTGDIFFGGFSKDDAILNTKPLIEYGGVRLETLITDEEVFLDRNAVITIKPEDIIRGYVSVWDDTKKLSKGNGRTTLRVSGTPEAKTAYKEALKQKVEKKVELVTVDKDVYDITYTLELIKDEGLLENITTTYNYVLDGEIVAAAATGDKELLQNLFNRNANRSASGIIKAIISNKRDDDVLNLVIDNGVLPTTEDLDLLFEPQYFDREKALILLERGAKPKNNMIYKAVAYKSQDVVYALFREGAIPRNNDLAYALELYHYPTVKALMSEEFEEFVAGKNELLLAAENNDEDLAQKFVTLGATADAYILDRATQHDNEALRNVIVPVTEASGETLEVVASLNDTKLFDYFVKKSAKIETNKAVEIATDNDNIQILDLALKNGGEPTEALAYAIKKENKPAIEVSLKNDADADAVFSYAAEKEDEQLFNDALKIYGGTPSVAMEAAVKENVLPMAQSVISSKKEEIDLSDTVGIAVANESLDMVKLLVANDANPNRGMREAIEVESVPITEYLITQGAETTDPVFIQEAVKKENLALSKVLIEKGTSDVNNAIVDASNTGNVEITKYLLDKGAAPDEAFLEAMETKNEDVILLLMDKIQSFDPSLILTASRKGNIKVVQRLLDNGLDATPAIEDALRYKKADVLQLLLTNGGEAQQELLKTAVSFNFKEGLKLLLEQNSINASLPFDNGEYATHILAMSYEKNDPELLTILIKNGVDINAQNKQGETALHLAALKKESDIALLDAILLNGASTKIKNAKGEVPLDYAIDKAIKNRLKKAAKQEKKG